MCITVIPVELHHLAEVFITNTDNNNANWVIRQLNDHISGSFHVVDATIGNDYQHMVHLLFLGTRMSDGMIQALSQNGSKMSGPMHVDPREADNITECKTTLISLKRKRLTMLHTPP
jgi:hypothetical protein